MKNPIIQEDESLTKEINLDFTDTLEHPEKVSRYLQYSPINKETFRVREIEVVYDEEEFCNVVKVIFDDTISFAELVHIQVPYIC
jgi:hypothetical protein